MSKKLKLRDEFWDDFDDLFKGFGDFFDKFPERMKTRFQGMDLAKGHSESVYTLHQDGKEIVVRTKNGETTVTVDGQQFVAKEEKKEE